MLPGQAEKLSAVRIGLADQASLAPHDRILMIMVAPPRSARSEAAPRRAAIAKLF